MSLDAVTISLWLARMALTSSLLMVSMGMLGWGGGIPRSKFKFGVNNEYQLKTILVLNSNVDKMRIGKFLTN